MMNSIEMTAKTTEDAISQGLEKLGVSISDVKVEILEEGSKGLFGLFGSRPAKVRLTLVEEEAGDEVKEIFSAASPEEPKSVKQEAPAQKPEKAKTEKAAAEKPAEKAAEKPARTRKPKTEKTEKTEKAEKPAEKAAEKPAAKPAVKAAEKKPAEKAESKAEKPTPKQERTAAPVTPAVQLDKETKEGKAQDFLQNVTKLMGLPEVQVHVHTDEEGYIRVDMQGDPSGVLIGRRGETLDSLQYLTSLYVNKGQSDYTRVTLDTENYRAKREDTLVRLANRMANRVVKSGRRVSLEPMNPYERRILHSALQANGAVETHSEGEEPNRHVVITLKRNDSSAAAE